MDSCWNWWILQCQSHERIFLLLTGSALLLKPPKMWSLSLPLHQPRSHLQDLGQSLEAVLANPAPRYLFETFIRGVDIDFLRHALFAAFLSCTIASVLPLQDHRSQFLMFTGPYWRALQDRLFETRLNGDLVVCSIVMAKQMVAVRIAPLLNSACACLGGATCVNFALTGSTQGWIANTLPVCGLLYQWSPVLYDHLSRWKILGDKSSDDKTSEF